MSLFDRFVDEALRNNPQLSQLRMVVEKELIHHDILRILTQNHLLKDLTFIGGTCLRTCYGAVRLSEDLDFTGGLSFHSEQLSEMGKTLIENLQDKYDLIVLVTEPKKIKEDSLVDTWKVKIETRPQQNSIPTQRINIDICALPSYDPRPMMLLNPYGVDLGTSGLIIQAQSLEEIYVDKLIAFALRPNRLKYRDLWDILWLHGRHISPSFNLLPLKIQDRMLTMDDFQKRYEERIDQLTSQKKLYNEFVSEMQRFLPAKTVQDQVSPPLWQFLIAHMIEFKKNIL